MIDIEKLWENLALIFPVLNKTLQCGVPVNNALVLVVCEQLKELGTLECVCEMVWVELGHIIRSQIVPSFWAHFKLNETTASKARAQAKSASTIELQNALFDQFVKAVDELNASYQSAVEILARRQTFTDNTIDTAEESTDNNPCRDFDERSFQELLREALLGQIPADFNVVVNAFYSVSFKVFAHVYRNVEANNYDVDMTILNDAICCGCNLETEKCRCELLMGTINIVNDSLLRMELLDRIAGQTMTSMVQQRIKEHINDTCQGIFDRSHLKQLEFWLDNIVINWLTRTFNRGAVKLEQNNDKTGEVIQGFKVKLTYYLYEHFANSVIDQFFSIIIDFPDSIPAIDDLKICLEKIDMRKHLIKTLKNSLEARILHPGVNTMDILTGYVAAIKAIRHLDSSGVILETVTAPIKDYLRKRSDTVRRVVTGLTEEGPTDLSEELAKGENPSENMAVQGGVNDELSNWENWQPDPLGLDQCSRANAGSISRSADIISMVVDIYGSKELFMNEYRNLMADRLLTQLDFSPEKEIRNLELLKLRFGETLLHSCEVMLKDVADSKRINSHIQSDANYKDDKQFEISTLIISAQFWPSFNKESLELPPEISEEFKKYTKSYEAYKGNRTLNWRNVTGRVNISIELGDRTIEMTVAPTQAIILCHFQEKNEWLLEDLSSLIKVPSTVLRRRIGFWQTHGFINEVRPGVFKLIEEEVERSKLDDLQHTNLIADDEEIESAMASASDQREEELQVFWSYIVGMLTNLDSLPIERIHQMLKLFASHGIGIEFSQEELREFLQRKVREHKLLFSGGVYQLAK